MAGSVDAIAYLLCRRVFVANMTGNTVLLAISLLQGEFANAALRGGLVVAFLASVIVTRLLARGADRRMTKKERICVPGLEALVLLLLAWKSTGAPTLVLLLLLAGMLGTQNGAFQYVGGFHLNTTFVTGDLAKLGEAMTDAADTLLKTSVFLSSWIGYVGGALLGTLGARDIPRHAFLVPMLLTVASAVAVMVTQERA